MDLLALINQGIIALHDTGLSGIIYQAWIVVVYIVVAVFCLFYRRHYGYDWFRALLIPLLFLLSLDIFILLVGWALTGFTTFGQKDFVYGCCFVPLMAIGFGRLMKDDWRRMLDFMTPGFPLALAVVKISCCFVGCCFGYPVKHGLYNPIFEQELFPVQIMEGIVALIVCFICAFIAKREAYRVTGRMYPIFLILFGGSRFFLEFLRLNIKLFWGISFLALWALLMVAVGVVWLVLDARRERKGRRT